MAERLPALGTDLTAVTLISDGSTIGICTSPEEVSGLLQAGHGVFGLALGPVWLEVAGLLAELAEGSGGSPVLPPRPPTSGTGRPGGAGDGRIGRQAQAEIPARERPVRLHDDVPAQPEPEPG